MVSKETLFEYARSAKEAVLAAGALLRQHTPSILVTDGKDVKITADRVAHEYLVEFLKQTEIPVLSEEGQMCEIPSSPIWVIDPLDGSMNFLRGIPFYAVSIALMIDKIPVVGVIYDFLREEMFTGIVGETAWLNDEPIHVSTVPDSSEAIVMTGFPSYTEYTTEALSEYISHVQEFKKVRLIGSAALSLAYVASGRADAYYEKDIKIWDVAAGLALVKAAGGIYEMSSIQGDGRVTVQAQNGLLT